MPGKTFRRWVERADYRPDDGPLITYEAVLEVIHIHLVDVYAARHSTAPGTRLRADRTLSPRGIELGGMFYASDELMALRCELASHNLDTDRVAVRYNPWDLGEVCVLNPIDNIYLKALAVDPAMKGMTEYQWRVLKRALRERVATRAAGRSRERSLPRACSTAPAVRGLRCSVRC